MGWARATPYEKRRGFELKISRGPFNGTRISIETMQKLTEGGWQKILTLSVLQNISFSTILVNCIQLLSGVYDYIP